MQLLLMLHRIIDLIDRASVAGRHGDERKGESGSLNGEIYHREERNIASRDHGLRRQSVAATALKPVSPLRSATAVLDYASVDIRRATRGGVNVYPVPRGLPRSTELRSD